jgi:NADH:ubiquinone oxidoreductase subunit E/anti-sigma regulatory factor (Ser/Thr protein kinase)
MRELSLHILDLIENAIRAGATSIAVTVAEDRAADALQIVVEDNGCGIAVAAELAASPFFTTKVGRRVGLGLSLLGGAAERTGGRMRIEKPSAGGTRVTATFGLNHIDRNPMGDLAGSISSVVFTHPHLELNCRFQVDGRARTLKVAEIAGRVQSGRQRAIAVARCVGEEIDAAMEALQFSMPPPAMEKGALKMAVTPHCTCRDEAAEAELLAELDRIIEAHRDKPGALIPVLQRAQAIFGYLPHNALKKISRGLNKAFSEVAGVVGFYSFFSTTPRGRHLVRVCLGTACYVRGGRRVLDSASSHLGIGVGETTPDREFSLEVARCFGACGLAPTLTVDSDVHQRVKSLKIQQLLDRYQNEHPAARKGG